VTQVLGEDSFGRKQQIEIATNHDKMTGGAFTKTSINNPMPYHNVYASAYATPSTHIKGGFGRCDPVDIY